MYPSRFHGLSPASTIGPTAALPQYISACTPLGSTVHSSTRPRQHRLVAARRPATMTTRGLVMGLASSHCIFAARRPAVIASSYGTLIESLVAGLRRPASKYTLRSASHVLQIHHLDTLSGHPDLHTSSNRGLHIVRLLDPQIHLQQDLRSSLVHRKYTGQSKRRMGVRCTNPQLPCCPYIPHSRAYTWSPWQHP